MPSAPHPPCSDSSATRWVSTTFELEATSTHPTMPTLSGPNRAMADRPWPISVVGLIGGECFAAAGRDSIQRADGSVGSDRQLALVQHWHHVGTAAPQIVLGAAFSGGRAAAERPRCQ